MTLRASCRFRSFRRSSSGLTESSSLLPCSWRRRLRGGPHSHLHRNPLPAEQTATQVEHRTALPLPTETRFPSRKQIPTPHRAPTGACILPTPLWPTQRHTWEFSACSHKLGLHSLQHTATPSLRLLSSHTQAQQHRCSRLRSRQESSASHRTNQSPGQTRPSYRVARMRPGLPLPFRPPATRLPTLSLSLPPGPPRSPEPRPPGSPR
mmetsp:Transcript_38450/g.75493  ORF Transcript_38450/g.75493 Transcript_38450/m.75493 type:complete len:208 (-) Transcript_38450:181-804(-)